MIWMDYVVESMGGSGQAFRIKGDWDDEVMGKQKDGSPKDHWLYKPGDVFVVGTDGWLRKTDDLSVLLAKYEMSKSTS